jgi:inosine/xanthosine triphosphate pyrophosphatase family protein
MAMAYKVIDAQKKLEAVKKYWADGNIAQISRETGASRATIYSWIDLADDAMLNSFKGTRPGPRSKNLQEENEALKAKLQELYNVYHKTSHTSATAMAATTPATPPQVCSACGSTQVRKNGTVPSNRQGTRQRYSCRQCSLSIYVVLKKKT